MWETIDLLSVHTLFSNKIGTPHNTNVHIIIKGETNSKSWYGNKIKLENKFC